MLKNIQPTFLHPISRQFSVDEVCEAIVRELEKRNWEVPGITVEFDTYGSGHQKFRLVRHLIGEDFKLFFNRPQHLMPGDHWIDTAAVAELIIPGKQLSISHDESGPSLNVYVGKDWEADREWFMNSSKVHTRMYNLPRRHLQYLGSISLTRRSYNQGSRLPYLIADSDKGRQYSPEGDEPINYSTEMILEEFRQWLKENVLKLILNQPERPAPAEMPPVHTPFPDEKIGPIYAFIEVEDVDRIHAGQTHPEQLPPDERYALSGRGRRFMSGVPDDGTVPKIAYGGFCWCLPGEVKPGSNIDDLPKYVGGRYRGSAEFVAMIKPKFAENIYVADLEPQERYKRELFAQHPELERMTDEQSAEYFRAGGRTIVPITEYQGGYAQPVVLIGRELDFDEVELVITPDDLLG